MICLSAAWQLLRSCTPKAKRLVKRGQVFTGYFVAGGLAPIPTMKLKQQAQPSDVDTKAQASCYIESICYSTNSFLSIQAATQSAGRKVALEFPKAEAAAGLAPTLGSQTEAHHLHWQQLQFEMSAPTRR